MRCCYWFGGYKGFKNFKHKTWQFKTYIGNWSKNWQFRPTRQQDVMVTSWRRLSVRSSDVAGTSQMKHKASQWYVSTTSSWNVVTRSQKDVTTTSHQCVFTTSETNLKWNTQRPLIGTSLRRLNGMYVSPVSPKWNTQ